MVINLKYETGTGVYLASIVEFHLPEGHTRFTALAALNNAGAGQNAGATIRFLVFTENPSSPVPPTKAAVSVNPKKRVFCTPALSPICGQEKSPVPSAAYLPGI